MNMIKDDFFWGAYNTAIAIGEIDNAFAYTPTEEHGIFQKGSSMYTIVDSGSTSLLISNLYFEAVV